MLLYYIITPMFFKYFRNFDKMTQSGEYVFFIFRDWDWYPLLDNSWTSETNKKLNNHDETKAEKQSAVFEVHNTFVSIRMWTLLTKSKFSFWTKLQKNITYLEVIFSYFMTLCHLLLLYSIEWDMKGWLWI